MSDNFRILIVPLFTIFIIHIFEGCSDRVYTTEPEVYELPLLEESIPFEFLGSGKILFNRIGPGIDSYKGFYIIDCENRDSWSIGMGSSTNPVLSNDGNNIAFTRIDNLGSDNDIYIMDIFGENISQITSLDGEERCPAWNLLNEDLIFWVTNRSDAIYTVNIESNEISFVKELHNLPGEHDTFYPTGRMSTSEDFKTVYASNSYWNGDSTGGLFIINPNSNDFEVLKYSPKYTFYESPRFSPSGESVAYLSVTRDQNWEFSSMEICIIDLQTDSVNVIYSSDIEGKDWADPSADNSIWLCSSPDGTKLLFSKPVADFTSYLFAIRSDGSQLTQVTSLTGVTDRQISWSK